MGLGDIVYEKIKATVGKEIDEMELLMSQITENEMTLARAGGTVTGLKRALKLIKGLLVENEE